MSGAEAAVMAAQKIAGGGSPPTFHDTAKSGTDNSSGTDTATADTLAVTAGDLIVVGYKWEGANGATVSSITDGTNTYSSATALQDHGNNDLHFQMFYAVAGSTGSITITGALSAARTYRRIGAMSFTKGAGGSGWTLGNTASGTPASNASPSAGSASATGVGAAVTMCGIYSDRTYTEGSGWTVPAELTDFMVCGEYQLVSGAGTLTGDGSFNAGVEWICQMAIFNQT